MKLGLRHLLLGCLLGCANGYGSGEPGYTPIKDGGIEAAHSSELVCADNFCGQIVDKRTGATADCGKCQGYSQCGDNGIANVCGSSCMPLVAPDGDGGTYPVTPACDLYFGPGWAAGYGTALQFPFACNYVDPTSCMPIYNQEVTNEPCASSVCGPWLCCVVSPDAGALLPGAVVEGDGGLP